MRLNLPIAKGLQWTLVLMALTVFSESVSVWLTVDPACETGDFWCRFNLAVTPSLIMLVSSILSASILAEFLSLGDTQDVPKALWLAGIFIWAINLVFSVLNHQVENDPMANGSTAHGPEQIGLALVLLITTAVFVFIGRSHMYSTQHVAT